MSRQSFRIAPDLATSATIVGDRVIYEVQTDNPIYRDSLLHIGFSNVHAGNFSRNLSASNDVAAIHRRFASHLQAILLQSARQATVDWQGALRLFLARVEGTGLNWFMYGSGALAVRGIDVTPGDLDICVDDADLAGHIFADMLIEPVTRMSGWVADRIGRAYAGCIIEWLSDVNPAADASPHEQGAAARTRVEHAMWNGFSVPVAPLDLQLAVLERRGLTQRAAKVRAYMMRAGE
jgi:hypothetical protein